MNTIMMYGFEGKFVGKNNSENVFPKINDIHNNLLFVINDIHNCKLFLSQKSETLDIESASKESSKFGFDILSINSGRSINREVLVSDEYDEYYEEAMSHGSAFVCYHDSQ